MEPTESPESARAELRREPDGDPGAQLIEFAAAASHDLSTPLQLISGYADVLDERLAARDKEGELAMQGIRRAVERMRALVDGLLGYARLGDEMAAEPVDAGEVVRDTLHALQPEIEASDASVAVIGELPVVLAIPGQLHQLFTNLISNALKFRSGDPPRVEIAATRESVPASQEPPRVEIRYASEPGVSHFTVTDNGIGIEPHDMIRIFDIFKRSRSVADRPGTGIGLAVSKGVVERHGGRIWVEPGRGKGTTIHFTLPVQLRREGDPPVAGPPEG